MSTRRRHGTRLRDMGRVCTAHHLLKLCVPSASAEEGVQCTPYILFVCLFMANPQTSLSRAGFAIDVGGADDPVRYIGKIKVSNSDYKNGYQDESHNDN